MDKSISKCFSFKSYANIKLSVPIVKSLLSQMRITFKNILNKEKAIFKTRIRQMQTRIQRMQRSWRTRRIQRTHRIWRIRRTRWIRWIWRVCILIRNYITQSIFKAWIFIIVIIGSLFLFNREVTKKIVIQFLCALNK